MRLHLVTTGLSLAALGLGSPSAGPIAADGPVIGDRIGSIRFTDTRYLPRELSEIDDPTRETRAYVVVFVTADCPIARRYLPRLVEIEAQFRKRGAAFLALSPGDADMVADVATLAVRAGIEFPVGVDFDGSALRALGATRTPEVCVLDSERRLRYRGRIDSQYRVGGVRPTRGREDLRLALDQVLLGRDVTVAETPVDGCLVTIPGPPPADVGTWADVAPFFARHCAECHTDGAEAPFALETHTDVASRAAMVAEVVREGRMPPWFASEDSGPFTNDRRLAEDERRMLVDWARGGAPRGAAPPPTVRDAGAAPERTAEDSPAWKIGEPDLVLSVRSDVEVPADGYVQYQYASLHQGTDFLPYIFAEDTWVQAIQIRPRDKRLLHHANLGFLKLGERWRGKNFLTGQVPGGDPMDLGDGLAVLIPAGSVLGLQMHYVTIGEEASDRIEVGLRFPHQPVRKRLRHFQVNDRDFEIPPFARAHPVSATRTLREDSVGIGLYSHMHLRGRDMTFTARYPDGASEELLLVPNFSFDWQQAYVWPKGEKRFPAGTEIDVLAHFDNSAFNPYNPDPESVVGFGLQTYHEMMYGFFFYVVEDEDLDLRVDPATGHALGGD